MVHFDSNCILWNIYYQFCDFGILWFSSWAKIGMSLTPDYWNASYLDIWVCYMSFDKLIIKKIFILFYFIASPIMMIASILIYIDSKDGIIFKQKRLA